jgi:hypothetical protein
MGKGDEKNTIVKLVKITKKAAAILEGAGRIEKRKLKNYMEKVLEEKAVEIDIKNDKINGK